MNAKELKIRSLTRQYRRFEKERARAAAEAEEMRHRKNHVFEQALAADITYAELLEEIAAQDADAEEAKRDETPN